MEPKYMLIEEEQEMEIDIKDMIASILLGWKIILCGIIVGMLLLGLLGIKKSMGQQAQSGLSQEERKTALRGDLTETEAVEVERIFAQYQVYQNFITNLSKYSSAYQIPDPDRNKMKVVKYYVVSSVKNINSFFTEMALSSEDYEKIDKIAYPGLVDREESGRELAAPLQFFSDANWDNSNYIAESDKNNMSKEATLITAYIIAEKENQCEEIQKVMEQAFAKEVQTLKEVDPGLLCKMSDAHYSKEGKEYYDRIERNNVDRLNLVNNALANMKNNFIDKFSDGQKEYFDFLKENTLDTGNVQKQTEVSASNFNIKRILKYIVLGAAAGCFIAGCWLIFCYAMDNRMKTSDELEYFGMTVLDTFYYVKNNNPIYRFVRKIRGIYPVPEEIQEQMLAEDIAILMKKENCNNLYLFMASNSAEDEKLADKMQKLLKQDDIHVRTGNPLYKPDQLKVLSESDRVVFLAHMKETKRESIKKAKEICDRYHRVISGAVAIEVC